MTNTVSDANLDVRWDPNVEGALLLAEEVGDTQLRLRPHFDDPDGRPVVLLWKGSMAVRMEPPNDEAISGHPLYEKGLRDIRWVGEVHKSSLIAEFENRNRVHARHDPGRYDEYRHWIVRLKGRVVEVVAKSCEVRRFDTEHSTAVAPL